MPDHIHQFDPLSDTCSCGATVSSPPRASAMAAIVEAQRRADVRYMSALQHSLQQMMGDDALTAQQSYAQQMVQTNWGTQQRYSLSNADLYGVQGTTEPERLIGAVKASPKSRPTCACGQTIWDTAPTTVVCNDCAAMDDKLFLDVCMGAPIDERISSARSAIEAEQKPCDPGPWSVDDVEYVL